MDKTIVYIFGPRRLASTYYSNGEMRLEEGGWLKIGQTTLNAVADQDIKDAALCRIRQETHTGIPEVCQIFDVFEYPKRAGKTDDIIRRILTKGVYELENSKLHNSQINIAKYEVKAGAEFVYGVSRNQVLNAVAKFEHGLILQYHGSDVFADLMQCIKNNAQNAESNDDASEIATTDSQEGKWIDNLWNSVSRQLSPNVMTKINLNPGRAYFFLKSKHKELTYVVKYSIRYGLTYVGVETYGGCVAKEIIEEKIQNNPKENQIKKVEANQGVKNKNKWEWMISDTINKPFADLVQWYVTTIQSLYSFFEN